MKCTQKSQALAQLSKERSNELSSSLTAQLSRVLLDVRFTVSLGPSSMLIQVLLSKICVSLRSTAYKIQEQLHPNNQNHQQQNKTPLMKVRTEYKDKIGSKRLRRPYLNGCNIMRGAHNLRLTDVHKIQKNLKEKSQREADALLQLMELPDFDTSEFIQTLLKSQHHEEVLQKLPLEKKIDFFAKNYLDFLQAQDELLSLQLPTLEPIPKAKQFTFEEQLQEVEVDDLEQSSVLQIIDSFSSFVLEKNTEEALRVYAIIQDMRRHSRYRPYFAAYSVNRIFHETYHSFLDSCADLDTLLQIGEYDRAIKVLLQTRQQELLQQLRQNLNLNSTPGSVAKEMSRLVGFIQGEVRGLRARFKKEMEKSEQLNAVICEWVQRLAKDYYSLIEPYVYEKDELAEILQTLSLVLDASAELETKGVTLERPMKELIAVDLPLHIAKVVEIIVQSVGQILKENNDLYQFASFTSIRTFSTDLTILRPITKEDFGKKCATVKGIILVNAFQLILERLCQEKWEFLLEGVLDILLSKVALNILACTLHHWDHYAIYSFFERLASGRVKHRQLYTNEPTTGVAERLQKVKTLSEESWGLFQSRLSAYFFKEVLSSIPGELWAFQKYGYSLQKMDLRPSTLGLGLVFKLQEFFRQVQFRVSTSQFQYLVQVFFEYILYAIEFVLLWSYHGKGTNDKVFILYSKQEKLLRKAKEFNFMELQDIRSQRILSLSKINKYGFIKLAFELYFLVDVIKAITDVKRIDVEQFNTRLAKILGKDQKKQVIDVSRGQFQQALGKMLKVYRERPELMQNYLNDRKKV